MLHLYMELLLFWLFLSLSKFIYVTNNIICYDNLPVKAQWGIFELVIVVQMICNLLSACDDKGHKVNKYKKIIIETPDSFVYLGNE